MKISTVFIILITFVIIITIFESFHDYEVIQNMKGSSEAWKVWGNMVDFGCIIMLGAMATYYHKSWYILLWIPIFWMTWWITHDIFLGYLITGDLLYIGQGKFDQFMGRIFQQSGLLYVGIRIFILTLMVGTYFRLDPEENYE